MSTQQPDTKPGAYYVTMIRNNSRVAYLAGPFINDHVRALELVDAARKRANEVDPRSLWDAFGTTRLSLYRDGPLPRGCLNADLGIEA